MTAPTRRATLPQLTVLSMGWGRDTWTMAAMMALGDLPPADFLVFADTHHEGSETYAFIERHTPWLREHGLNVITVQGKRTEVVRQDWSNSILIPAYTLDAKGSKGQVMRQCTHDWKIVPIRHFIREELERRGLTLEPGIVVTQMGICADEFQRMRDSDVAYITNEYPLVDRRITKADAVAYLEAHGLPIPPKSACTFCPFKSKDSWRRMKQDGGADWQEAVAVDALIRHKRSVEATRDSGTPVRKDIKLFVHPARLPLAEAVTVPQDDGNYQPTFDDLCDGGVCGV